MEKQTAQAALDAAQQALAAQTAQREALRGHVVRVVRAVVYEGDAAAVFDMLDRSLPVGAARRGSFGQDGRYSITVAQADTVDLGPGPWRDEWPSDGRLGLPSAEYDQRQPWQQVVPMLAALLGHEWALLPNADSLLLLHSRSGLNAEWALAMLNDVHVEKPDDAAYVQAVAEALRREASDGCTGRVDLHCTRRGRGDGSSTYHVRITRRQP